jgi:hypothetical protein
VAREDHGTGSAPAEFYYPQLDALRTVRQQVRLERLVEGKKQAWKRLCQIPSIGPIRAAMLLGILQTPHRFTAASERATSYAGARRQSRVRSDVHPRLYSGLHAPKGIGLRPAHGELNHKPISSAFHALRVSRRI